VVASHAVFAFDFFKTHAAGEAAHKSMIPASACRE
jgi:hypothetical protein